MDINVWSYKLQGYLISFCYFIFYFFLLLFHHSYYLVHSSYLTTVTVVFILTCPLKYFFTFLGGEGEQISQWSKAGKMKQRKELCFVQNHSAKWWQNSHSLSCRLWFFFSLKSIMLCNESVLEDTEVLWHN